MKNDLYRNLKKAYDRISLALAAKSFSYEMENGEEYEEEYDIPILRITYRDLSGDDVMSIEEPFIQVRVRDDRNGEGEELVMVLPNYGGFVKKVTDIDKDLADMAGFVEKATEGFLEQFPDVVYDYKWTDITLNE